MASPRFPFLPFQILGYCFQSATDRGWQKSSEAKRPGGKRLAKVDEKLQKGPKASRQNEDQKRRGRRGRDQKDGGLRFTQQQTKRISSTHCNSGPRYNFTKRHLENREKILILSSGVEHKSFSEMVGVSSTGTMSTARSKKLIGTVLRRTQGRKAKIQEDTFKVRGQEMDGTQTVKYAKRGDKEVAFKNVPFFLLSPGSSSLRTAKPSRL